MLKKKDVKKKNFTLYNVGLIIDYLINRIDFYSGSV